MRPGSSAAAPTQLGESAWCDVMHVLHSFIRPRSVQDVHFASTAAMGLPSLPRRPRLRRHPTAAKLVSVGWIGPRIAALQQICMSLLESLLESGSRSTPTPTPGHSTPPSSFWASSAPGCRNWLPPSPRRQAGSSCALSHSSPRVCTQSRPSLHADRLSKPDFGFLLC